MPEKPTFWSDRPLPKNFNTRKAWQIPDSGEQTSPHRYTVEQQPFAAGGQAGIYYAFDHKLGRQVALKIIPSDFLPNYVRPKKEAQAQAQWPTHQAVPVYDYFKIYNLPNRRSTTHHVIVMAYMDSLKDPTLKTLINDKHPFNPQEILIIAHTIAQAQDDPTKIDYLIYDLKPSNLFVNMTGKFVRQSDFGFAKIATDPDKRLGTPMYLPPETILQGEFYTTPEPSLAIGSNHL